MENQIETPLTLFIHLEKAGGTSLHNTLLKSIRNYTVLPPLKKTYGWRYDSATLLKIERWFGKANMYGGHQVSSIPNLSPLAPGIRYFTFLRDPITRFISHANWLLHTRSDYSRKQLIESELLSNCMCFRLSGKGNFEDTKKHIDQNNFFFGLLEQYELSIFLLSKWLELENPMSIFKINVLDKTDKNIVYDELSITEKQCVIEKNKEDLLLYNYIKNEIWERQIIGLNYDVEVFDSWASRNSNKSISSWLRLKSKVKSRLIRSLLS